MSSENKPTENKPRKQMPYHMKFVLGGSAGMTGAAIVQPFELIKTRMQLSSVGSAKKEYTSSFHCFRVTIAKEGFFGLYKGIGAALLRQATYTTSRLGVYTNLNEQYKNNFKKDPGFPARLGMGIVAGSIGAFVGTPADLALIRMSSDGRLPEAQRRNYTNVLNALVRITREEGITTLWRGCIPTVVRAIVVNMAQLATYSQAKSTIVKHVALREGIQLHFVAAMLSGLITTIASMPVDIVKTRIQNMKYVNGVPEYQGAFDVLSRLIKQEGVLALWKGFTPYYARLGPHTVLTLMFLEQYNKLYFKYVMGVSGDSTM